ELADVTGRYFLRDTEHRSPEVSYDRDLQQRVWAASHAYTFPDPACRGDKRIA
ncbi:MAG: hypothetical protein QOI83_2806, partial [Streptomycetaceae bacterium]|nr:hypothetical protein [Streptomycetaceae bacterium]